MIRMGLMVFAATAMLAVPGVAFASAGIPQNGSPASQCAAYVTAKRIEACLKRVNDGKPVHMSKALHDCLVAAGITVAGVVIGGVIGGAAIRAILGGIVGGGSAACIAKMG